MDGESAHLSAVSSCATADVRRWDQTPSQQERAWPDFLNFLNLKLSSWHMTENCQN